MNVMYTTCHHRSNGMHVELVNDPILSLCLLMALSFFLIHECLFSVKYQALYYRTDLRLFEVTCVCVRVDV
jgi:hypothetical protein